MRESSLEAKDRKRAAKDGWFVDKIMKVGRDGFPDRFYARANHEDICKCCGRGRVILIEWKQPGKGPTPIQARRHVELRAAGVEVYVVSNLDEAARIRSSAL